MDEFVFDEKVSEATSGDCDKQFGKECKEDRRGACCEGHCIAVNAGNI